MRKLKVYSGKVLKGVCGTPTNLLNIDQEPLFVGDIVVVSTIDKMGVCNNEGISVVVEDSKDGSHFVMGIKSVDFNTFIDIEDIVEQDWMVKRIKSHEDCIDGEHWKDFGFNYHY